MLAQQQLMRPNRLSGPNRNCAAGALNSGRPTHAAAAGRLQRARRAKPFVAAPPAAAPWLADEPSCSGSSCGSGVAACSTSLAIAVSQTSRGLASGLRAIAAPPTGPAVHHPRRGVLAAASKGGSGGGGKPGGSGKPSGGGGGSKQGGKKKGGEEDKADPNKADFSAYWSLRFREFFSGRRQYLELSRKRQEPPEIVQKVDAQIEEQQERLEEATQLKRDVKRARYEAEVLAEAQALAEVINPTDEELAAARRAAADGLLPSSVERMQSDLDAARAHLQSPGVKVAAITALQLRAAARAVAMAPLAVPAALLARWRALFADRRYETFLLAEGERVWYWRNRMENERWFWEVFIVDRVLIPALWILGYLFLVPNNIIWAVVVPFVTLYWQDGKLPSPRNMEWWLIMIFGFYGKCWHHVVWLLSVLLQWW